MNLNLHICTIRYQCIDIQIWLDSDRDDLPVTAQEMITTYFPKAKISMIKVDKHLLKKIDYDVKLVKRH